MANLVLLGAWHALSTASQYATAFRRLGHRVTTVGPRFTAEDAERWQEGLLRMAWPPTAQEAALYVAAVLAQSPVPDVETEKGAEVPADTPFHGIDAFITFWAYGETPTLANSPTGVLPTAIVYGDTHTGHLAQQVAVAADFDHVFVQYRRADLAAFDHPSKHWLPAAADPTIWTPPPPGTEPDIDVLFVGSTDPAVHRERVALIEALQAQGIDVTVKHAFGRDAAALMGRANVVLNRSLNGDLNLRVMEALACRSILVTDEVDGLHELDLPCLTYVNGEGALLAVQYALTTEAQARVNRDAACKAVLERHTYEHRCRQVLDVLGLEPKGEAAELAHLKAQHTAFLHEANALRFPPAAEPPSPRVSLIIPAFNHFQDCTWPLLAHLANTADAREAEVLVIDDGSTDATAQTHQTLGARVIHHAENRGYGAAVNTGARAAKGHYLVILNNDTLPREGWLSPLIESLDRGALMAGSLILNPDGTVQSAGLEQHPDGTWWNRTDAPSQPREERAVMGACFAIRKSTYWLAGGMDEQFQSGCEDTDFALRIRHLFGESKP